MVLKMFCYAGFLQEMPPERDAPEAPPDAKRIRLLEEKAEKMERYMTQILSVLSRKPAPVSSKQSEVTSEAGPSSLPTASCLLSPQTAPSQPAPAAVSPPQSAPAAAPLPGLLQQFFCPLYWWELLLARLLLPLLVPLSRRLPHTRI
ncbi:hypothetical protein M8J76_015869 [Diaphorina citri]|nr:hypothetical protein M8J75_008801 [Diaphorina citri]KAI5730635.1 hypothetical protein M8J76_015869 [Diaphorina citri]